MTVQCSHRGAVKRTISCVIGSSKPQQVEIFECGLHGECTLAKAIYGIHGCDVTPEPPKQRPAGTERPIKTRHMKTKGMGDNLASIIESNVFVALASWLVSKQVSKCGMCKTRVLQLNSRGPDWASRHVEDIVGWLREGHAESGLMLPFSETVARGWVEKAIAITKNGG